jgi:hypothetical protein
MRDLYESVLCYLRLRNILLPKDALTFRMFGLQLFAFAGLGSEFSEQKFHEQVQ